MRENYYEILGVPEKATKDEIKKAFHKLSLKYHPDRNPNNSESYEMFQKINNAYETLSDDQKRKEYDCGDEHSDGIDLNDILSGLFAQQGNHFHPGVKIHFFNSSSNLGSNLGASSPFVSPLFGGGISFGPGVTPFGPGVTPFGLGVPPFGPSFHKPSPPPIQHDLTISFYQAYTGDSVPIEIKRWIKDQGEEKENLYVNIPKGIDDGEIIVLKEKGHVNDQIKGDVKIYIKIENKAEFERVGLDLVLHKKISLKEALCGFNFSLKHINNRTYTLSNGTGNIVTPSYKKVIPNMGMERETTKGSLIINFEIEFPLELTTEAVNKLKEIL